MATGKRFYWIKLKDSFLTSETVDFLMSQKEGANYVVLYQMLCLKTLNTNGRLERQIGEVIVQFDTEKIQRDCKYFTLDTVRVALELYKKLGLVYVDNNGVLVLADYENLVGSETDYAQKKRVERNNKKIGGNTRELPRADEYEKKDEDDERESSTYNYEDNGVDNNGDKSGDIVPIEIRDKRLDIRDKIIDNKIPEKEDKKAEVSDREVRVRFEIESIIEQWNSLSAYGIPKIRSMDKKSPRYKYLSVRLDEYGFDTIVEAIRIVEQSPFLMGENDRGWTITFDWFIGKTNFVKVLEGNYLAKKQKTKQRKDDLDDIM